MLFPNGVSPKVNVIVRLGFELTYYNIAVQHVSHYTTGTPFSCKNMGMIIIGKSNDRSEKMFWLINSYIMVYRTSKYCVFSFIEQH